MRTESRGGNRGEGREERGVYVISVAADLAGVHPQTLRIYERRGLLQPKRTAGNSRRYSERDVDRLREIQRLTQEEGVNLAGVRIIMTLELQLQAMREELDQVQRRVAEVEQELDERTVHWGPLVRLRDVRNLFESR